MALVTTDFIVNITPGEMPPTVHVSEYDIGRSYTIGLIGENDDAFTIPSGATATIEGTLNGAVGFSAPATISNNKVAFTLTESMTAYAGKAWCKIKLTQNSQPIQTCAFILDVDRAGVEAPTVIGAPGFDEQIQQGVADYLDDHQPFFTLPSGGQDGQALVSDGQGGAEWGNAGVEVDTTLSVPGKAADAAATGMRINSISTSGGSGLTGTQIAAISALFQLAVYTEDPSDAFDAFIAAFPIYQDGSALTIIGGVTASLSGSALTLS